MEQDRIKPMWSPEHEAARRAQVVASIVAWYKRLGLDVDEAEVVGSDPTNDLAMPLDHFVWFDGEVQNDGRSGYWQFYEPEAVSASAGNEVGTPGVPCIRIDWRNSSRIDRRLAFLLNKPDVAGEGSTLVFEEVLEMATIEFYDAASDDTGAIIWHRDGSGSIEWPDFDNGVKGCWDVWQRDVVCP